MLIKLLGDAQNKNCEAITRLDLIAIVAMVGVLLALAFSSGAKQRSRIYQMTDVDNHRRILAAVASYAADHTDTLPNPAWGWAQPSWLYAANPPLGPSAGITGYQTTYWRQLQWLTNGQLFSYINDSRIFMCPADAVDSPLAWQREIFITSYLWNGAVCGFGTIPGAYKLSQFRPDAILEWEGDDRAPFYWNDGSLFPDEGVSARHGEESLVGQFGGSVGTVLVSNWYTTNLAGSAGARGASIPSSMLPNRLWCNPGSVNGR